MTVPDKGRATTIAVFADVHGNTPALAALFAELDSIRPDLVVNLGDIASGGVDPRGTLDLLATRPDVITVRGNHERQLLEGGPHVVGGSDWLAARVLDDADVAWFRSLPQRVDVLPRVLAFHGSPDNDLQYLLETVDTAAGPNAVRTADTAEVLGRLGSWAGSADLFLCGHTHLQRSRRLPDGSLVVNPGSLGWPAYESDTPVPHRVEVGAPQARFSTVTSDPVSRWRVTHHALDYDVRAAVALALANGRSDVAHALSTGRVAPRA